MDNFSLKVLRKALHQKSITGELWVSGQYLCRTLELPWRFNARGVSCIPQGKYSGFLRYDKKDKWRIQLKGVPGRSGIQIHIGSYPREIEGCILLGMASEPDKVSRSEEAYKSLRNRFYQPESIDEERKVCIEPISSPAYKKAELEVVGLTAMSGREFNELMRKRSLA